VSFYLVFCLRYGERNATFYDRREHLQYLYDRYKYVLVKDAPALKELDKKADEITNVLQPCGEYGYSLLPIPSTYFVADLQSKETLSLKKNTKG